MTLPDSAKIYSVKILKIYDFWVLKISNSFAWKCNTQTHLVPFFRKHMKKEHMDIGVGTGFYLRNIDPYTELTLCDINLNSLFHARKKSSCSDVRILKHNIIDKFSDDVSKKYNSVSLFYVLHCLKGNLHEKCKIFDNIVETLKDDGVFYGATILGVSASHNTFGKILIKKYNSSGVFGNYLDNEQELRYELEKRFSNVNIIVIGTVALFEAKKPITLPA